MTEPDWVALGPGNAVIDFVGGWSAAINYLPGNIVRHNGIDYLAVNPSIGQAPPAAPSPPANIDTSFPVSPINGEEFILVDSLTTPTYLWRFRYVTSMTDYKWVFIGGTPLLNEIATDEATASTTYVALTTPGPVLVVPRNGIYIVEVGAFIQAGGNSVTGFISYDIGATPAVDADAPMVGNANTYIAAASVYLPRIKTLTAVTLTAKYKTQGGTARFAKRWMSLTPVRVS